MKKLSTAIFVCVLIYSISASAESGKSSFTNSQNCALLMIEFQNEWLGPDAKLSKLMKDKDQFETSKTQAKKALSAARKAGIQVVHVGLLLNGDYSVLGKKNAKFGLRKAIQKYGTWDEQACKFAKGYEPKSGEFIVQGRTGASGFAGSNLDSFFRNNNITCLYLAGYALHVCVESTLRDAHDKGYEAVVLEDATSAFTEEQKKYVLKNIIHHFGTYVSVDQFVEKIDDKNE